MTSYAVQHQRDARDSHSDHGGSSEHGTFHDSRSNPETLESRSNPETEYTSASEGTWTSKTSQDHKDLIHKIKKLLDITDDDHERLLKEIQNLQEANGSFTKIVNSLHRENKEVSDKNQILQDENNHLQNIWHNLTTHVIMFMENFASLQEQVEENASYRANRHGMTHDNASQTQHGDLSISDRLYHATRSLKDDDDRAGHKKFEKLLDDVETTANTRHDAHTTTHRRPHFQDKQQQFDSEDERPVYHV